MDSDEDQTKNVFLNPNVAILTGELIFTTLSIMVDEHPANDDGKDGQGSEHTVGDEKDLLLLLEEFFVEANAIEVHGRQFFPDYEVVFAPVAQIVNLLAEDVESTAQERGWVQVCLARGCEVREADE